VKKLDVEGKEVTAKITQLQANMDHEAVVQQGQQMSWSSFGESRRRETLLKQLSEAQGELEKKT